MVEVPSLDRPYVEKWAAELKVLDLWRRVGAVLSESCAGLAPVA